MHRLGCGSAHAETTLSPAQALPSLSLDAEDREGLCQECPAAVSADRLNPRRSLFLLGQRLRQAASTVCWLLSAIRLEDYTSPPSTSGSNDHPPPPIRLPAERGYCNMFPILLLAVQEIPSDPGASGGIYDRTVIEAGIKAPPWSNR